VIFVDTGALLARYIAKDEHHGTSTSSWSALEKSKKRLFTSNFVLNETFTLLGRRTGYAFAAARARAILSSTAITILRPSKYDEIEAVKLFEKYADQSVSYTDCISFVLMRSNKIEIAFTFDRHFKSAGFTIIP
jgi:predicted nucleic acid-binding protein